MHCVINMHIIRQNNIGTHCNISSCNAWPLISSSMHGEKKIKLVCMCSAERIYPQECLRSRTAGKLVEGPPVIRELELHCITNVPFQKVRVL